MPLTMKTQPSRHSVMVIASSIHSLYTAGCVRSTTSLCETVSVLAIPLFDLAQYCGGKHSQILLGIHLGHTLQHRRLPHCQCLEVIDTD